MSSASCATRPRARYTRTAESSRTSAARYALQERISAGSGRFCGGTHLTALTMRAFTSARASSAETDTGALASPASWSVRYRRIPAGPLSAGRSRGTLVGAAALTALGNQHRELESLLVIEARVHRRSIGPGEIVVREPARPSGAFGHVIPGELDVHAAEIGPHVRMNTEREVELLQDVLEAARLDPARGRLGIAVHGVAYPERRLTGLAHRFDRLRERGGHVLRAEAVDEGEPTGLVLGIEGRHQALQPRGIHGRADLDGDGIRDAAEVLDVRAFEPGGAHADPGHVRREVVPAVLPRNEARLCLLVVKVQPLVARVEVDQRGLVDPPAADAFEEIQRIADRAHDPLVGVLEGRVVHEAQVTVLRMVQVGEAALDQRPYEVQRQRRALIPSQQQLRIRRARLGRELRPIDQVAPVARQADAVSRLGVGRARLGVLAGHAPHAAE